jgi:hypothetical protein
MMKTTNTKQYLILLILTLTFHVAYSQANDFWQPRGTPLSYHPKDFLTNIRVFSGRDSAGKQVVNFALDIEQRFNMALDSMTFESEDDVSLTLNIQTSDSALVFPGGRLSRFIGGFYINHDEVDFLKEKMIKRIIFYFYHKALPIVINHRSKGVFMELF